LTNSIFHAAIHTTIISTAEEARQYMFMKEREEKHRYTIQYAPQKIITITSHT
jgi:hypothetical protein